VADAAGTRHEDHADRGDAGDRHRVVRGAADDVELREAFAPCGFAHALDAAGVERRRRLHQHRIELEVQAFGRGGFAHGGLQLRIHRIAQRVVGMADVQRHAHLARHHVAAVRADLQFTDGGTAFAMGGGDAPRRLDHARGADQRVAPPGHRRGAGVGGAAAQAQVVPALPLSPGHRTDGRAACLEHRALFDVGFEIGRDEVAAQTFADVADARQLVAIAPAGAVTAGQYLDRIEQAGIGHRAHHRRREACAFLVAPDHQFERRCGVDAGIVQRAQHFEPGHHAVGTVEAPAVRLGIEMAAGHHHRPAVVAARPPREDVADRVDAHGAAGVAAPAHEQVARAPVVVVERQALDAAAGGGADLGQRHQAGPQPRAVDARARQGRFGHAVHRLRRATSGRPRPAATADPRSSSARCPPSCWSRCGRARC
jgi:hypothetical protein